MLLLFPSLLALALGVAGPWMTAIQPDPFTWLKEARVTVYWGDIPSVSKDDWVSVWWHTYEPTYVQFKNVTSAQSGGHGDFTFTLLNARHKYSFRYYRGDTILATSNYVQPDAGYPNQIRLTTVQNNYSSIRIAWTTNDTTGVVQYGLDPSLGNTQTANNFTYTHDDINNKLGLKNIPIMTKSFANIGSRSRRCGKGFSVACSDDTTACAHFVDPGVFHEALLMDLKPRTTYYYRVGAPPYFSDIFSFTTFPLPGDRDDFSVLYIADGGVGANGPNMDASEFAGGALHNDDSPNYADTVWATLALGEASVDHLAILNGDISYANGWPYTWEVFHNLTEPTFRAMPVQMAYGNHDFDYGNNPYFPKGSLPAFPNSTDSGGEAGIPCGLRFAMPLTSSVSDWVGVQQLGSLTLITLSGEHNLTAQAQYLDSVVFPSIDRAVTPWVVVQTHRPMFTSNVLTPYEVILAQIFAPLFEKYAVDMVVTGHNHYYERLCSISQGKCTPFGQGVVYIVDGSAGANPTHSTPDSPLTMFKEFDVFGFSRLVANATYLTWTHLHAATQEVADSLVLGPK